MIVTNKRVPRTGRLHAVRTTTQAITAEQLLGLSLTMFSRWIKRKMLEAHLRTLHGQADYFNWQQTNGSAGLADVHKRIAMAKSDLLRLQ